MVQDRDHGACDHRKSDSAGGAINICLKQTRGVRLEMAEKMLRKILLLICFLLLVLIAGLIIFMRSGSLLPEGTDALVDEVLAAEPREYVSGTTGTVMSGETRIWYNVLNEVDTPKATVLLIMGHSTSILGWPDHFFPTYGRSRIPGYSL